MIMYMFCLLVTLSSSFITYHQIVKKGKATGVTSGAEIANFSGALELTFDF